MSELERVRELLEELESQHSAMISARDLTIRDLRTQLAAAVRERDEAKLANEIKLSLHQTDEFLALAVEALEWYAARRWLLPFDVVGSLREDLTLRAKQALTAIRGKEMP